MLRDRSLCIVGLIRNLKVDILVLVSADGRCALPLASGNGCKITFSLILSAEGRAHTLVVALLVVDLPQLLDLVELLVLSGLIVLPRLHVHL